MDTRIQLMPLNITTQHNTT